MSGRETVEAESPRLNKLEFLHGFQTFVLLTLPEGVLPFAERTQGYVRSRVDGFGVDGLVESK